MSQAEEKANRPERWVAPRVIKLDSLPVALGLCYAGSTHSENPGGICRNGGYPQRRCKMGTGGA